MDEIPVAPFVLVLARVGGLMVNIPYFGGESVPVRVRVALSVLLAYAMMPNVGAIASDSVTGWDVARNVVVGLGLGLVVRVVLSAADVAAEAVSAAAGLSFDQMIDPNTAEMSTPLAHLWSIIVGFFFFQTGAHHEVLRGLNASLKAWPVVGSWQTPPAWQNWVLDSGGFVAVGMQIALPLLFVFAVLQLGLGLMARWAPQLNPWSVGFGASAALLLVLLPLFASSIGGELGNVATEAGNAIHRVLPGGVR